MLLDTLPMPSLSAALLPYIFSAISLLVTFFALFRKEAREDGQTPPQRLKKLEAEHATLKMDLANQIIRQQGFQVEIENVADYGKRERQAIIDNAKRDHDAMQNQIKDVPIMRDMINRMAERLESVKETNAKIDTKMDKILDVLTHK